MNLTGDWLWALVSFVLTLLVFSYLTGENPFFRFVSGLLIGVSAGYFAVIIVYQVILMRLVVPLLQGSLVIGIPLILSGMLLMKLSPRLSPIGNLPMAILVGAGAAIAIGGAVLGTLFGQIRGALSYFDSSNSFGGQNAAMITEGIFFLAGTLASFSYFSFRAKEKKWTGPKRPLISRIFAFIGQVFIAITLGSIFAGVMTAAITALVERTDYLISFITSLAGS